MDLWNTSARGSNLDRKVSRLKMVKYRKLKTKYRNPCWATYIYDHLKIWLCIIGPQAQTQATIGKSKVYLSWKLLHYLIVVQRKFNHNFWIEQYPKKSLFPGKIKRDSLNTNLEEIENSLHSFTLFHVLMSP